MKASRRVTRQRPAHAVRLEPLAAPGVAEVEALGQRRVPEHGERSAALRPRHGVVRRKLSLHAEPGMLARRQVECQTARERHEAIGHERDVHAGTG